MFPIENVLLTLRTDNQADNFFSKTLLYEKENNRGAVEYDQENYFTAKGYFQDAVLTLQKFTSNHSWMDDYKYNLSLAQRKISKRQRVE